MKQLPKGFGTISFGSVVLEDKINEIVRAINKLTKELHDFQKRMGDRP